MTTLIEREWKNLEAILKVAPGWTPSVRIYVRTIFYCGAQGTINILAPEVRERSRHEILTMFEMLTDEVSELLTELKLAKDRQSTFADMFSINPIDKEEDHQ